MRAIFCVLLVANIAFFVQQFFFDKGNQHALPANVATATSVTSNNLKLLAERNGIAPKKASSTAIVQAAGNEASQDAKGDLCTTVGPYEELLQAEYLVEQLSALGVESKITSVEVKEGDAYWVYLPPEMSEKEALRRLYELQKKNIESYIITKGELANGISFGRFADTAEAEIHLKEIKDQGYSAQIKTVPKTISETWVVLNAEFAGKIAESAWVRLLARQEGIEKRQNFCLGVASQ